MFSNRLKLLRKKCGLTQVQFAQEFNVANGTVGMWETGKREPDFETVSRIADFFGVSTDYLLCRTDQKEQPPTTIDEGLLRRRLVNRLISLTPEEQDKVDAFVQGMIAARPDGLAPPK